MKIEIRTFFGTFHVEAEWWNHTKDDGTIFFAGRENDTIVAQRLPDGTIISLLGRVEVAG